METQIIVQSGGSTGRPKVLSRSICSWTISSQIESHAFGIRTGDRFAVIGASSHSLWTYAHFRAELIGSSCIGVSPSQRQASSTLSTARPTVIYGVPELVVSVAARLAREKRKLESVRLLILGGGPWPVNQDSMVLQSAFPRAGIWIFYGSAETSFIGYGRIHHPLRLFDQVQLKIHEDEELWVKSPMTISPEVWIKTGDLGRWVSASDFLLTGRASRQLIRKGIKYAVEPIESWLAKKFTLPRIALIDAPRERCICMVDYDSKAATLQELNQAVRTSVIGLGTRSGSRSQGFPRIYAIHLVQPWPLTATGKTDFSALRAQALKL